VIIYTWQKYGQLLRKEVLNGVVINNCELMVISSKSNNEDQKYDEQNIYENRKEAFDRCLHDIFLGMDSDVILRFGVVSILFEMIKHHDVVIWPEKHNFFGIKKSIIEKYPFDVLDKTKCSLCQYFDMLRENNVDVYTVDLEPLKEI